MSLVRDDVQLTDGVVLLRSYSLEDFDALFEAARESIAEMSLWLPWCHHDYTVQESIDWIRSRAEAWRSDREYSFAIFEKQGGRFVGGSGINLIDRPYRRANLGYWIRTSATGRGYATRAARLVARFGFEKLEFERIEIVAAVGNDASQRVAQKVGATREAVARKRLRMRDTQNDAVVFSLIRSDML